MANGLSRSLRDAACAPSAFSRVYEAKAQEMLTFFLRRTFDVEVARDLTAETFAQAFQFGIGPGLVVGDTLEGWRRRLGGSAVVVLHGPAAFGPRDLLDDRGRFPLLGVTVRDVASVELQYAEGPPLVAENGDGGFVLLADAWRPLRELIAYDETGRVRERTDLTRYDMSYLCEREPGCPPGATPGQP